jgi:hypothetical protein
VGKERLELSPREGLEPKSSASTNFATRPVEPKRIPSGYGVQPLLWDLLK